MGLAKKGSRKINVAGKEYRWVVSSDSGYAVVVVELSMHRGQRLIGRCDPYPFGPSQAYVDPATIIHRSITPKLVTKLIIFALSQGWLSETVGLSDFIISADHIFWPS